MNYKCFLNQQCHTVTENQLGVSQVVQDGVCQMLHYQTLIISSVWN